MNRKILRQAVLVTFALVAFTALTGCDKAEQVLEKTDLGTTTELTSMVKSAVETLGGIKDIESAKAALPALKQMNLDLDGVVAKVKDMSPEQKSKLTSTVGKAMPQLEGAIEKVKALDGVGPVIGSTLDSFHAKFKSML